MSNEQAFTAKELADIRAQIQKDEKKAKVSKGLRNLIAAVGHAAFFAYLAFSVVRAIPVFTALLRASESSDSSFSAFYYVFSAITAVILVYFLIIEGRYLCTVIRSGGERIPVALFPSAVYLLMLLSIANRFGIYTHPMTQVFPFSDVFLLLTVVIGLLYAVIHVFHQGIRKNPIPFFSLAGCAVIALILALLPIGNLLSWSVNGSAGDYSFDLKEVSLSKALTYMESITQSAPSLETNTLPIILALGTITAMVVAALLLAFRGKEKPKSLWIFLLCLILLLALVIGVCPPKVDVKGVAKVIAKQSGLDLSLLDTLKTGLDSLGLSFGTGGESAETIDGLNVGEALNKISSAASSVLNGTLGEEGGLQSLIGGAAGFSSLISLPGADDSFAAGGEISDMFGSLLASGADSSPDEGKGNEGQTPQTEEPENKSTAEPGSLESILKNHVSFDSIRERLIVLTDQGEEITISIAKPETPQMQNSPEKAFVCIYRDSLTEEAKDADVFLTCKIFYLLLFSLLIPFMAGSLLCLVYLAIVGDEERRYSLLLWCKRIAIGLGIVVLLAGIFALTLSSGKVGVLTDENYRASCRFHPLNWIIGMIGFAAIAFISSIPWYTLKKRVDTIGAAFRNQQEVA